MATIRLTVNGKAYTIDAEPQTSLLSVLREQLDLTDREQVRMRGRSVRRLHRLDRRQGTEVVRHQGGHGFAEADHDD
jgi:hypothetical protein